MEIIITFIVALAVLGWGLTIAAKGQTDTLSPHSPEECMALLEGAFPKLLWADVSGPGTVNKRRRAIKDNGPVLSIKLEGAAGGGTAVSIWASTWTSRMGMMDGVTTVLRKRYTLARRLA